MRRRQDGLALLGLTTAVLLFFWPVISGAAWIPRGGGDLVSFIYPMYRFAAHSLQQGELPLWNPTLYAGAPFISDNQSGLFYPVNLLLFFLRPTFSYAAIQGLVIVHFWLAGLSMYLCLRGWRQQDPILPLPALFGAIAFAFSDLFITHIGNLNLNAVMSWLPLSLLLLHRSIEAERWKTAVLFSLAAGWIVAISTLAGHGQMTFMTGLFLGSYGLYRALVERNGRSLLLVGLVGLVGVGGAAISLLPAAAHIPLTPRAGFDFAQSTNYSIPLAGLVGAVAPDFYGRGILNFWGGWPRVEVGYMGVLPLLLLPVPFLTNRWREGLFFGVAFLFFGLLALGENAPLYELLFARLPIVPFQVPARFVVLSNLCAAMLAGLGLDHLLKRRALRGQTAWLGTTAVLLLLLTLWLGWQANQLGMARPEKLAQMQTAVLTFLLLGTGGWAMLLALSRSVNTGWLTGTAVLLLALDLIGLGWQVEIEPNNPTLGFPTNSPALSFIQADDTFFRIDIATGEWQPSTAQLLNLYDIGGVFNPLQMSNYNAYIGSMGYRGSPAYNLLGVKYVIGQKDEPPGDANFLISVFEDDPAVTVYLNTRALPRAMVVQNTQMVPDLDAAFTAVHAADFDPTQTVILTSGQPLSQTPAPVDLLITRYDLNRAAYQVQTEQPAYLVLSDLYHPGWRATVNGQTAVVQPANYALRAIYLPSGVHDVQLWFVPPGWRLGVAITAVTALLSGLLLWIWGRTFHHQLSRAIPGAKEKRHDFGN